MAVPLSERELVLAPAQGAKIAEEPIEAPDPGDAGIQPLALLDPTPLVN